MRMLLQGADSVMIDSAKVLENIVFYLFTFTVIGFFYYINRPQTTPEIKKKRNIHPIAHSETAFKEDPNRSLKRKKKVQKEWDTLRDFNLALEKEDSVIAEGSSSRAKMAVNRLVKKQDLLIYQELIDKPVSLRFRR
jgi:hypothetical protein